MIDGAFAFVAGKEMWGPVRCVWRVWSVVSFVGACFAIL